MKGNKVYLIITIIVIGLTFLGYFQQTNLLIGSKNNSKDNFSINADPPIIIIGNSGFI